MTRAALALVMLGLAASAHGGPGGAVVRVEHHDVNDPPSRGPRDAPVTIEMLFSPAKVSRLSYLRVEKLQAAHPGRIRLLYRVIGRDRLPSAVLEAHAEGLFFEMMTQVLLLESTSLLGEDKIVELGRRAGIDPARLADAIKREPFDDVVAANQLRAEQRVPPNQVGAFELLFNGKAIGSFGDDAALERAYVDAYDRATDLLDRGVAPDALFAALDADAAITDAGIIVDEAESGGDIAAELALLSPPLDLHGLPSFGPADAPVTIAVLCDPASNQCANPLSAAETVVGTMPGQVRLVWQPFYDPGDPETRLVGLLGDGALCAERLGTNHDDARGSKSAGWLWLEEIAKLASHGVRHVTGDVLLDRVAENLGIDGRKLAACRARIAGTTVERIESASHSGVHAPAATVVGGRVYPPINLVQLQALVARELAPGVLDSAAPWTRVR